MTIAIKAYYDGSGNSRDPNGRFLTLAGYAGTPRAWCAFEEKWKKVLQRWDCAYLHMNEAHSLKQEFAVENGWTENRVKGLLQDLINECLSSTGWGEFKGEFRGVACTINLKDYAKIYSDMPSYSIKEPEAICVDYVVTVALMGLSENRGLPFGKEGKMQLFFDHDEPSMHKINRVWKSKPHYRLKGPLQLVHGIETADMRETIGLQAADFLAWQTNRYYTHGFDEPTGAFAGIVRVLACPAFGEYFDYEHLKENCLKGVIIKRS